MLAQIITANRLGDGAVVYLTADRRWSEDFAESALLAGKEAAEAELARANEFVKARLVVGPYLIDAKETAEGPQPTNTRERIRASRGPTIEVDAGSWTGRIGA